jgi:hypothetical protein
VTLVKVSVLEITIGEGKREGGEPPLYNILCKILASAACSNSSEVGHHLNQPEYQLKKKRSQIILFKSIVM